MDPETKRKWPRTNSAMLQSQQRVPSMVAGVEVDT